MLICGQFYSLLTVFCFSFDLFFIFCYPNAFKYWYSYYQFLRLLFLPFTSSLKRPSYPSSVLDKWTTSFKVIHFQWPLPYIVSAWKQLCYFSFIRYTINTGSFSTIQNNHHLVLICYSGILWIEKESFLPIKKKVTLRKLSRHGKSQNASFPYFFFSWNIPEGRGKWLIFPRICGSRA